MALYPLYILVSCGIFKCARRHGHERLHDGGLDVRFPNARLSLKRPLLGFYARVGGD